MVLVQRWPFFQTLFLAIIGKKNVFRHILERKKAFLGYKNKKLKKSKNWHFSKGVNPWLGSKKGNFSKLFFLGNIGQENVFYNIIQRKISFLGYKNKKLKKGKTDIFPNVLTHGFGPKITVIPTCFFTQYRQEKCLLRYFTTQTLLSRP